MSVVVKGMQIHENCSECMRSDLRTAIKCTEWKKISAGRRENERAWSCPLVDLGKHGDLIDKNSLKETLDYYIREAGWGEEINKALGWVKDDFINSEPTVIEAEGTDEGSN